MFQHDNHQVTGRQTDTIMCSAAHGNEYLRLFGRRERCMRRPRWRDAMAVASIDDVLSDL